VFLDIYHCFFKNVDTPKTLDSHVVQPSTKRGLVGLALSGGGVRSATFNLGLLQSLSKNKVLQYCDDLSTVSGGGYIGSCLTSLLANTKEASTS
jgi:predicted acylesterase/phospholipase RssA